jgi:hypothetical protein
MRWILAVVLAVVATGAGAAVEGEIALRWGDAHGAGASERIQADLATKGGQVLALDAASLAELVGDVSQLDGRRVRASLDAVKNGGPARVAALQTLDDAHTAHKSQANFAKPWITLLCKFADVATEPRNRDYFEAMMGEQGWMADYWAEQSGGRTDFAGSRVEGWYVLPHPRSHYVQPNQYARLDRLFNDCVGAALDDVDFTNGGAGIAGINLMFNAALDCCAWGGGMFATLQGLNQRWSVTWNPPFAYTNPAALAHEMGHAYGLPHANNSDGDGDTYDNPWDLMSDPLGHAVRDPVFGRMPKRLGAYSRARLGWVDNARLGRIDGDGVYRFRLDAPGNPAGRGFETVELRHPYWPESRWLVLEVRDTADPMDRALPGRAVILHTVDSRRAQPAWVVDSDDPVANYANTAGSQFGVGRRFDGDEREFSLRVLAEVEGGFEVELRVGQPIFSSRFGEES